MKRFIAIFGCLTLFLTAAVYADFSPGIIMVKFKPGAVEVPSGVAAAKVRAVSVQALNARYKVSRVEQLYAKALENRPDWTHLKDYYVVKFPKGENVAGVARAFAKDPNVVSAAPSKIFKAFDTTPNDPRFTDQYGLTNLQCPQAWDRTTGSSGIVIAVLDTGIDTDHEDFVGRIDSRGYDFVNEDADPEDDYGHGTSVAGVVGATTDNSKGVAGVDWSAKLLIIKVLDNSGNGSMTDILQGIVYANSLTVEVMNMSFGQYVPDSNLQTRCTEAYNNGVALVAAAGNGDVETWNGNPSYPAGYSNVLAIAAVDQNDVRSVWSGIDPITGRTQASNYGTWVDISAPGSDIWSTEMGGGYDWRNNGTSLSAPFVAGVAGLVKAANPGLTNQEIYDRIKETADDIDSLQQPQYQGKLGSGRVNAANAVAGVNAEITSPQDRGYITGTASILGTATGWNFSTYEVDVLKSGTVESNLITSNISVESGALTNWNTTGKDGEYRVRLKVFSSNGSSDEASVNVFVDNIPPVANITVPTSGASVSDNITITGTASDQYIDYYLLQYGEGASPTSYQNITRSYISVSGGVLGTWETAGLSGTYTIKLTAYDKVGATSTESVQVDIQSSSTSDKRVIAQAGLPLTYGLPNPFDRSTTSQITLNYTLNGNYDVRIFIFDLSGNLIWQNNYTAGEDGGKSGENNPSWNGQDMFAGNVPNGLYVYQVTSGSQVLARGKIIVLN
ncbi:MAG: S8 family serine peptidase [Candidatus Margulisiibacteriota bacterium]|nr:S8 family serine peptidase [Candidatus Margulisiibacteriota bacterium]